ncbi:MAG: DsbA family oxidoreductase [Rhodobacteraceae bacterium]|nr:DsbA family oxidoreductase [Paracoccaceae bacterium]
MSEHIQIDIVSDVVCPWCVIGYRQLEQALSKTGIKANVQWHPFELNPKMPPEGQNLRDHLAEKYGTTPQQSVTARQRLSDLGADLGFVFDFNDDARMVNTFQAHQLIEWASDLGRQSEVKLALFKAHFSDARDVSDIDTLVAIATESGLDGAAARVALTGEHLAWNVRTMQQFWVEKGVRGVPAMVFDKQHLLSGAQGAKNYATLLRRLNNART